MSNSENVYAGGGPVPPAGQMPTSPDAGQQQSGQVPPGYGAPQFDPSGGYQGGYFQQQPPVQEQKKSKLGLIALILSILGTVLACVPGIMILGWILLPVAFILSIVAIAKSRGGRALGIWALVISVVGTIVAFIAFGLAVTDAVDDAFNQEVEVSAPADSSEKKEEPKEEPKEQSGGSKAEGTRENPLSIGSTISTKDWEVTVNSVTLDATKAVSEANQFNDPPAEGSQYILVNYTAKYVGDSAEGQIPWASIDYVTAGGNTIKSSDNFAVAPDQFDGFAEVYSGASVTGNEVLEIPTEGLEDGVLAVSPDMFADTVFFAMK